MAKSFTFELITPEGLKYESQVYQVQLPTTSGTIGVLAGHQHMLTLLTPGVITVYPHASTNTDTQHLATIGGFVHISSKRVRILADSAERADEIDEFAAKQALEKARAMQANARDTVALSDALGIIERETARLKVAGLKRRRRTI